MICTGSYSWGPMSNSFSSLCSVTLSASLHFLCFVYRPHNVFTCLSGQSSLGRGKRLSTSSFLFFFFFFLFFCLSTEVKAEAKSQDNMLWSHHLKCSGKCLGSSGYMSQPFQLKVTGFLSTLS